MHLIDMTGQLFPKEIPFFITDDDCGTQNLLPSELSYVANKPLKRKNEFIRSRACLKHCLKRLKLPYHAIIPNDKRFPVWPSKLTGCISHSFELAGGVISPTKYCDSIGLDIEKLRERKSEHQITRYITTDEEWSALQALDKNRRLKCSRLIFCSKEAIFKCLFPLCRQFFGFKDATVQWNPQGTFEITLLKALPPHFKKGLRLSGRWMVRQNFMFSGLMLNPKL